MVSKKYIYLLPYSDSVFKSNFKQSSKEKYIFKNFKYVNYDYLKDIKDTQKDFHTVQILVQYNKPLYFDQDIEIGVKIKEIGKSSMIWIMGMFLKETGELVSSCEAVHVYTDQTTMQPTPITDDLKENLQFN